MKSLSDTFFGRVLGRLADAIFRHRWVFLWPQILLFGVCVIYTVRNLQFDPSRDNLVGSGKKYHQLYLQFKHEFPAQDDMAVVVESENPEKNRQFVERLGTKLEAEPKMFADVFYKGDLKMMGRKALLFVPESDLKDLQQTLGDYLPFIQRFTQTTNLNSLFEMVNSAFLHAKRETNAENDSLIKAIPMLDRIVKQAAASLQRSGTPPSPGVEAMFGSGDEAEQQIYITFNHGGIFLVTARARTAELIDPAVERIRDLVAQTQREVPGLNVGLTGESVLDHDEMEQSQNDSILASLVSLVVCALIFIYGYQQTGRPLKATFCLIIGLGYTLAYTTLVVGHLNILTITFLPILIGLAIDFGVHLVTRYEEELRLGRSEETAMRKAIVFTGQGIFTGALTTSVAFLAMGLTNFRGIQEMGVICGGGMLICFVPMMTLLPVLLYRGHQNEIDQEQAVEKHPEPEANLRSRIENIWLSRPRTVVVITVALSCLAWTQFHKVYFDYNLLNLEPKGLQAVVFAKKLIRSSRSVLFAAVTADTAQQAVELEERLKKLPAVESIDSMAEYLTEDQSNKLRLIGQIKEQVATVHFAPVDPNPVALTQLSSTLYSTYGYLGAAADDIQQDQPELAKQLLALRESVNALRREMLSSGDDDPVAAAKLAEFQRALFDDFHETFQSLRDQDNRTRLQADDLPPALHDRFIGVTGKYLLQVNPRGDAWQRATQEEFVRELREVYPDVTGTPVQLYEYSTLLKDSYVLAAKYALGIIVFMVLIHFRTVSSVILALLPVGVGCIWMGGLMGWTGEPFNLANIMTLPLVIGIGVTNGIHILNRYAEEKNASILSKSTGKAVFVSGLTAISGFGSLMLGRHQGIKSLGYLMSMGVTLCMIAALTLLPAVLNLLGPGRRGGRKGSATSADSAISATDPIPEYQVESQAQRD